MKHSRLWYGFASVLLCSSIFSAALPAKAVTRQEEMLNNLRTEKETLEFQVEIQNDRIDLFEGEIASNEELINEYQNYLDSHPWEEDGNRILYEDYEAEIREKYEMSLLDFKQEIISAESLIEFLNIEIEEAIQEIENMEARLDTIDTLFVIWGSQPEDIIADYLAAKAEADYRAVLLENAEKQYEFADTKRSETREREQNEQEAAAEAEAALDDVFIALNMRDIFKVDEECHLVAAAPNFDDLVCLSESYKYWEMETSLAYSRSHAASEANKKWMDLCDDLKEAIADCQDNLQHIESAWEEKDLSRYFDIQLDAYTQDDVVVVKSGVEVGFETQRVLPLYLEMYDSDDSKHSVISLHYGEDWYEEHNYCKVKKLHDPLTVSLFLDFDEDGSLSGEEELLVTQQFYLNSDGRISSSTGKSVLRVLLTIAGGIGAFLLISLIAVTVLFRTSRRK